MKVFIAVLILSCSVSLFAETVSKLSGTFSFPLTPTGIAVGSSTLVNHDVSFNYRHHLASAQVIELSWALPAKATRGTISIFSVSGAKVKTFSISDPKGTVKWDYSKNGKFANGLYFATLSYGAFKQKCKIVLY